MKGRGHLSEDEEGENEDGEEDEDEAMSDGEASGDDTTEAKAVKPLPVGSITAPVLSSKKPTVPFNASGSLGVTVIERAAPPPPPTASTSASKAANHNAADATSARPPIAPAKIPATVGSGLKVGAQVVVVKRKVKEKGRFREMAGKGKGRATEESEESESDFDSSDDTGSDEKEGEADEEMDGEGSWKGISEGEEENKAQEIEMGGGESSSEEESDDDKESTSNPKRQKGAFQAWAESQVRTAAGLPSTLPSSDPSPSDVYVPLLPAGSGVAPALLPEGLTGPMGAIIPAHELPTLPPQRSTHIPIIRTEEMQKQRHDLPIVKEEDRIMDAIRGNPVVVICGETGSGKTTQIGQFLWEAGWGDKSSGELGFSCSFLWIGFDKVYF